MLPNQQQQLPIYYPAAAVAAPAGGRPPRPPSLAPLPTFHAPHHHHHKQQQQQAPQSFPNHLSLPLALGVGQPTLGIVQPPLASLSFPAHPSVVSGFSSIAPIPLSGQALPCSQAQTLHHGAFQLNGCNLPLGHGQNVPPASVLPPNPHHPGAVCNGNFSVHCPPVQTGQSAHHPFHGQLPFGVPYAQASISQHSLLTPSYLPPTEQPPTNLPPGPGPPAALQNHAQHLGAALQHQRMLQAANATQGNLQGCDSSGMAIGYPVMGIPVHGDGTYGTPLPNVSGPHPRQHTHYAGEAGVLGSRTSEYLSSNRGVSLMSQHAQCRSTCVQSSSATDTGKIIKEHILSEHCKKSAPTTDHGLKAAALHCKETEEDIRHWREERKLNYPTTANIRRKTEETMARKARGELVDEGGQTRRKRLREILARQAELGLPVAEIPSHYLSDRSCKRKRHETISENNGPMRRGLCMRGSPIVDKKSDDVKSPQLSSALGGESREGALKNNAKERERTEEESPYLGLDVKERNKALEVVGVKARQAVRRSICRFFLRGHCKKGSRCEFLHERRGRNRDGDVGTSYANCPGHNRVPTLLSKLLEPEIRRDKSHLLQCFRFIVNNSFLLDWPNKPLKFFEWVGSEDTGSDSGGKADDAQESLVLGSLDSADRGMMINVLSKENQLTEQVKKDISSIPGENKNELPQDVNLDIEGTDPVDLWLELQQRLIEDAESLGCFEDGF